MKVQSTGLGKTVMVASFKELLNTQLEHRKVMQLTMEATEPLHWTIKVYMEPKDVRRAVWLGFKPSLIWKALLALLFGRFSLFSKTEPEKEEPPSVPAAQPTPSPAPSAASNKDETPSPLAKLKG
jgi:hypothetical protein